MENVFVLLLDNNIVGVYTTHRNATQTIIVDALENKRKLLQYSFQFDSEFFTYVNTDNDTCVYELMEVTPDARA